MKIFQGASKNLSENGFIVLEGIYNSDEIQQILNAIETLDLSKETVRKSRDLFAIRQFLKEIPEIHKVLFNNNLLSLIKALFGEDYFIIKSIYFDKPEASNWFVSYHQDLTISVDKKVELQDYTNWTVKQNQFAVQAPLSLLQNIFTIRIHLDDTDKNNGALKIIPKSHLKGIYRHETIDWNVETETICDVPKGGVMIMKPLLLHGSNKSLNHKKRRVIHLEFSNQKLPAELQWSEKQNIQQLMLHSKP